MTMMAIAISSLKVNGSMTLPQLKKMQVSSTNRTYTTYKTYSDLLTINRAYEDLVGEVSTGYPAVTQALVPPITLIKLV
jgi:hypothetical protein